MEKYFREVVTACEVPFGKPAPDIYLEVAKRLGAKQEDCLVFEDVPAGIMAGKRAGMTVYCSGKIHFPKPCGKKRKLWQTALSVILESFYKEQSV